MNGIFLFLIFLMSNILPEINVSLWIWSFESFFFSFSLRGFTKNKIKVSPDGSCDGVVVIAEISKISGYHILPSVTELYLTRYACKAVRFLPRWCHIFSVFSSYIILPGYSLLFSLTEQKWCQLVTLDYSIRHRTKYRTTSVGLVK